MGKNFNEYDVAFDNVSIKMIGDASQFRVWLLHVDEASPAISS
jgi:hypothetical protein